jgi:hypothetical protein
MEERSSFALTYDIRSGVHFVTHFSELTLTLVHSKFGVSMKRWRWRSLNILCGDLSTVLKQSKPVFSTVSSIYSRASQRHGVNALLK